MTFFTGPIKETFKISIEKGHVDKTVQLTWPGAKVEKELQNSLLYDVECFRCKESNCQRLNTCKNVAYKPGRYNLTKTAVEISNLQPGHRYKFKIYPKTVINKFIDKKEWVFSEETFEQPPLGRYIYAHCT